MKNSVDLLQNEDINLRLRTLNFIRWIAVLGQFSAVVIAFFYFQIAFNIYICILLILLSVTLNIAVSVLYPLTKILNYNETFFYLVFDLIQLISLLYLTGGLTNPFSVLILAPLVIAATYLDFKRTVIITVVAIVSLNFLAYYYYPLESATLGIGKDDFSGFEIFLIWSALVITSIFITAYCFRVADDSRKTRHALRQSQLSLSNEEQVSALMSLTAAAVHELGTPLSTISIINKELVNNNKDGALSEDLLVIQSQLERCKEILERLRSNNLSDKSNEFINQLNFIRLINEIVSLYDDNKIKFDISFDDYFERDKVVIPRSAELVHSLTNIIDNAFKYAVSSIEISLKNEVGKILIEIVDDGPGFASEIYPFLGEPYLRNNRDKNNEGLGLGLFISKNLLAKSLGEIKFLYRKNKGGCVQVILIKSALGIQDE